MEENKRNQVFAFCNIFMLIPFPFLQEKERQRVWGVKRSRFSRFVSRKYIYFITKREQFSCDLEMITSECKLKVSSMTTLVNGDERTQLFVGSAKLKKQASSFPLAILFDVTYCSVHYWCNRSIKPCSLYKDILRREGKCANLADETNHKYSEKELFKIVPNILQIAMMLHLSVIGVNINKNLNSL